MRSTRGDGGRPCTGRPFAFAALALGVWAAASAAAPVPGFREEFPGTSTGTWGGGTVPTNPGTGGVGGAADGYLDVRTLVVGNLAANSGGPEYSGNWTAAGVTQLRAWLRDLGGSGTLSIHLLIGAQTTNLWSHDPGFVPPTDRWAEYVVDLTRPGDFTQVRGSGTFAAALQAVDRLNFRHDLPPYVAAPDPVLGGFGLDHLLLTDGVTGVGPSAPAVRPVRLSAPWPNPARGRTSFTIESPGGGPVTVRVLDANGRLVRRVDLAAVGAAPRVWLWDGRDDAGRAMRPGVYRVLATGEGGGTSRSISLLR